MARVLCYTSPARGHLYPVVPTLLEAQRRGHEVHLLTVSDEAPRMRALGLTARAIASKIEAIRLDDWKARTAPTALARAVQVFAARAEHEVADLGAAIEAVRPDVLLVDFNAWGAAAVAERSGLPWALFMPYFLPWRLRGLPPFGPGWAPRADALGRLRDAVGGAAVHGLVNRGLGSLNAVRRRVGLGPLAHAADHGRAAPLVIHFTAEPFEYACADRPARVRQVGPCAWEPAAEVPQWLDAVSKPLVVVSCSSEFQDDGILVRTALDALAEEDVFVVATSAGAELPEGTVPPNARVERFVPHGHLLPRAEVVVTHGGMGVTQKALAAGVPVCVVPFGRDQLEVARHVEVARAGVWLPRRHLTAERLRRAVAEARGRRSGAERVAKGFRDAAGAVGAADVLDELMVQRGELLAPGVNADGLRAERR